MEQRADTSLDTLLVRRTIAREPAAVEEFLERMRCVPRMLSLKNARFGAPFGPAELEDFAQEVLISVWKKLDQYRGLAPLEAWIYRFVHFEMIYSLRKRDRRPDSLQDAVELIPEPAPESTLDDLDASQDLCSSAYRALETVGPPQSEIIRMKHLEGLTFREIADRMNADANTVKTRYYRGLARVRRLMGVANPASVESKP